MIEAFTPSPCPFPQGRGDTCTTVARPSPLPWEQNEERFALARALPNIMAERLGYKLGKGLHLLVLLAMALTCLEGAALWTPAEAQAAFQPTRSPRIILGRRRPGKVTGFTDGGVTVELKGRGAQIVQYAGIWRIRRACVNGEPRGSTVVDFGNNRLFVRSSVADFAGNVAKKIPLVRFTAPNGKAIYIAAGQVTDISGSQLGLHNPASKAVIGTRNGAQQIIEPVDDAKRLLAAAQTVPTAGDGDVADRR